MDLARFDVKSAAQEGADLHLKNPFTSEPLMDDGKPVCIRVLGRDAATVQDARKEADRLLAEGKIDEEERGRMAVIASVVGWSEALGLDGGALPYSPENTRKLLTDPRTDWIGEQIIPFVLARRNFARNIKDS